MDFVLPRETPFWLRNARVPQALVDPAFRPAADFEGLIRVNIQIVDTGTIGMVVPEASGTTFDTLMFRPSTDLGGRVVSTCFSEIHAHIDKTQTWERAPNADGTFNGAKTGAKTDRRQTWSEHDVRTRMTYALEVAYARGIRSMRTHIDSQRKRTEPSWTVFDQLRREWSGRVALQGVISLGAAKLMGKYGRRVGDLAADYGGVIGPVLYNTDDIEAEIERAFDLAEERHLPLDFHVDETLDPSAYGLEAVARAAINRDFPYGIVCSHNCALAMKPVDDIDRTLKRVRDAGIGLVALPMTNLYLQDRQSDVPRLRAMMPVRRAINAGVKTAAGGDNCRDAFHPYGDYDMVEVLREAVRLGHLDDPPGRYFDLVTGMPESMMGMARPLRLDPGNDADLVIFEGRSLSQLFARLGERRMVLRRGKVISTALPDFPAL